MTSWFEPVSAYCERTDAAFWAEPLNALSNAGFLAAAFLAAWRERRGAPDPACLALAALAAVVGVGSFLFHTLAVRWAMLADVVPIAVFIHAYFFLAMRRFLGLGIAGATAATAAFAALSFGLTPLLDAATGRSAEAATNGSVGYAPAALALVGVAGAMLVRPGPSRVARRAAAGHLVGLAALFLASLTLRTLDRAACPGLPTGTHFLWHLLNAALLFGLIATALAYRRARPEPA